MSKSRNITLIIVLSFFLSCTKEKIVTIAVEGKTPLEQNLQQKTERCTHHQRTP